MAHQRKQPFRLVKFYATVYNAKSVEFWISIVTVVATLVNGGFFLHCEKQRFKMPRKKPKVNTIEDIENSIKLFCDQSKNHMKSREYEKALIGYNQVKPWLQKLKWKKIKMVPLDLLSELARCRNVRFDAKK